MTIAFNSFPIDFLAPGIYAEFNAAPPVGLPTLEYKLLLIGQKRSTGAKPAHEIVELFANAADEAKIAFGDGSMLHHMAARARAESPFTRLYAVALDDNGAGVQATGNIIWGGTATAQGTINLLIGGRRVQVLIASGTAGAGVATAVNSAVNAAQSLAVTSAINGGDTARTDFTARHKGEAGNEIDLRVSYNPGESLPPGITATITAMASGATNPTLTSLIAALGEQWFNVIAFPYKDSTSLAAIEAELLDRWGPIRQIEGLAVVVKDDTVGNLSTFGNGRNSFLVTCGAAKGLPTPDYETAAVLGAIFAREHQQDAARQCTGLTLKGVLSPKIADRFLLAEVDTLLHDGISPLDVDSFGNVRVGRMVTMNQVNDAGTPDRRYLDVPTIFNLGYIRFSVRDLFAPFRRHKLADDGIMYDFTQPIMTPSKAIDLLIDLSTKLAARGLIQNLEDFKARVRAERDPDNKTRLNIFLPFDLVGPLYTTAVNVTHS